MTRTDSGMFIGMTVLAAVDREQFLAVLTVPALTGITFSTRIG